MFSPFRGYISRVSLKVNHARSICVFNVNCSQRGDVKSASRFDFASNSSILHSSLLSKRLSLSNITIRTYASGEYDNLWAAATGGRGVGRGRKKKQVRGIDPEISQFGKEKMTWPGFTVPINLASDASEGQRQGYGQPREERQFKPRQFDRGWSGTKWPGRSAGPPILSNGETMQGFSSIVIELKRVSVQTGRGKRKQMSAVVAIGNKNGAVGWAIGKGQIPIAAIRKARNRAANYIQDVEICNQHTIFHDLKVRHKSIRMAMERKPDGYGLRCQRVVRAICELAGIKDMRCKVIGGSTPQTILRAAMLALKCQETHQELAERTGRNVVEFRSELGNQPIVVASPTEAAVRARIEREASGQVPSSIELAFDPTRGLHRTKSLVEVQMRNPDL